VAEVELTATPVQTNGALLRGMQSMPLSLRPVMA
jgi:hypothetical protein